MVYVEVGWQPTVQQASKPGLSGLHDCSGRARPLVGRQTSGLPALRGNGMPGCQDEMLRGSQDDRVTG
eukprot:814870-Pelagomonas_calceolata.AAC.1